MRKDTSIRGGSRTAATSKMERFVKLEAVNYYHKALHFGCCSSPRSASEYLGILERDDICQEKMKAKMQNEYYKRVRAVLKCKLNGGIVITGIII